jgi:hypothetical protein
MQTMLLESLGLRLPPLVSRWLSMCGPAFTQRVRAVSTAQDTKRCGGTHKHFNPELFLKRHDLDAAVIAAGSLC